MECVLELVQLISKCEQSSSVLHNPLRTKGYKIMIFAINMLLYNRLWIKYKVYFSHILSLLRIWPIYRYFIYRN